MLHLCHLLKPQIRDTIAVTDLNRFYDIKMALSEVLLLDVIVESEVPVVQRMADRFIFTPNKSLSQGASALDVLKFAPLVQFNEKTSLFSIIYYNIVISLFCAVTSQYKIY